MNRIVFKKTRELVVCVMLVVVAHGVALSQVSTGDRARKIDEVLSLANKYQLFNGSVLVAENGKVIHKKGYGLANMEWNIPNSSDTRFRLGSITKQFTAALILQLVDEGKVKLDGKLSDYLPTYRKDIGDKVTIHQLLNHTSGIPSYTGLPGFFANVSRNPYTVEDFVKLYASNDFEFEPGSKYSYNNSGYFLLGAIIEKVTGQSYDKVLKARILDPLGMKNTGYDLHAPIIEKRATGYQRAADGYSHAPYLDMSIPYAAGSMYSTVEDLYLWDQALYTDRVVSAQSKALMYKPTLADYAYGWVVRKVEFGNGAPAVERIMHGGGINGFNTLIIRYPQQKHLIVLLDNTSQGESLDRLQDTITKILFNQPYTMPKQSIVDLLQQTITEKGLDTALAHYRDLKAKQSEVYDFSEPELNRLGYRLLQAGKQKEAIEIFKLNVAEYPKAFNPYDSLGEAYMVSGNKELAILNYKKSLELNPQNNNATAMLKRIESNPVTIDPKTLDTYVGEYELNPTFKVRVFREGEKLMAQANNQPAFELIPEAENKFFVKAVNATLTFQRDPQGVVTGLLLQQSGRDVPGKKIK